MKQSQPLFHTDSSPPSPASPELPCYLEDEAAPPGPNEVRAAALKRWAAAMVNGPVESEAGAVVKPFSISSRLTSTACFFRIVDVPGRNLAQVMPAWWDENELDGGITLGRELRLGPLVAREGIWSLRGRLHRPASWPSTPVVVELWPHNNLWSGMALRPLVRVVTSRRYFRAGHDALDALKADLVLTFDRSGPL